MVDPLTLYKDWEAPQKWRKHILVVGYSIAHNLLPPKWHQTGYGPNKMSKYTSNKWFLSSCKSYHTDVCWSVNFSSQFGFSCLIYERNGLECQWNDVRRARWQRSYPWYLGFIFEQRKWRRVILLYLCHWVEHSAWELNTLNQMLQSHLVKVRLGSTVRKCSSLYLTSLKRTSRGSVPQRSMRNQHGTSLLISSQRVSL